MANIDDIVKVMRSSPGNVRFADVCKVCDHYFGQPRQRSGSHRVYKMPWMGDPRVNIQDDNGYAKGYQVKQVLRAIGHLEVGHAEGKQ